MTVAAVMAMTGCSGNDAADESTGNKVYHIGIIQQMEHGSLDQATKGFEDKLTELLGENNVEFDYQNAQGEQANCTTISTKFVSDGCDLIMANATTALQTAAAATSDIPIVGTSVTDYVTAGVVESNEAPGKNVTGVSDLASVEKQIDVLMQFCDKGKHKGCSGLLLRRAELYRSGRAGKEISGGTEDSFMQSTPQQILTKFRRL